MGPVVTTNTNDYARSVADRVVVPVRLRRSSVEALDRIAEGNDWSRSDALRYLFRLGLTEHERRGRADSRYPIVDEAAVPMARPVPKRR